MANKTTKQPTIKLTLTPGSVSPAMRYAWVTFWKLLIAGADKREVSR